ncbi:hypothetical protein ET495_13545 [Xylanimonas allomyrinae]|uniref:Uncharacterized protein n=1 Tax=Xylanimonas allomyrinae TaxID=2509459 RepID=A0A4P6EN16_9MICO|nr:hypothetical protein [Xylanimonas allomyrinae]QAY64074.1 hypothetical protein ET495_13545 [Xylanimonas allomyrinae]
MEAIDARACSDPEGRRTDADERDRLCVDPHARWVGYSVRGVFRVSTAWTGGDASGGDPVPLVYETLVTVAPAASPQVLAAAVGHGLPYSVRYPDRTSAVIGHDRAIGMVVDWLESARFTAAR